MDHGPAQFSPLIRQWFTESFPAPTPAQAGAWEAIASGAHTLVVAPTGSGKTLAAFLWAIDRLITEGPGQGTRVLYVSPLKALAVDIERNLRSPLAGLMRLDPDLAPITVGVRTGDTTPTERRRLVTHPPDILITTPESLFLMLTSGARDTLVDVDTVIVDEVHALAGNKRGSHLALSLARLDRLAPDIQRIGCSATVRPVEVVADFLTGGGEARVVAPPSDKDFDLTITVPVPDLANPPVPADEDEARNPSIWPHVEQAIVDRIEHTSSTLVFTNSRRLSERLTTRLNELWLEQPEPSGPRPPAEVMAQAGASRGAEPVLARAHHGSVSRERRREIEDDLKAGRLRAVVATSTLELGIDMGAVDLVIQVQSPPGVASGLQRVGRAGHQVGAVSRAVVYPTHRGDLLAAAVTVDGMLAGELEPVNPPRHPLDVLAQQIVAALAMDDWDVDDLYGLIRSAWPYRALPRSAYEGVLDMLAGRYPSEEFATLRPRILWDRTAGTLAGRPGTARLAVTNAGTIPDRGHFGVFLAGADRDRRVGELDEEMVYESRVGDVFALGSTSWRIEDITPDRVLVTPAPGAPARLPFWHGDTVGRPYPLGRALGEFLDRYASGDTALPRPLDPSATDNLAAYLDEQLRATGTLPGATAITIEQFTDELGDRRVILHSPFGARVHAPWALIIADRIENRFGIDGQVMAADDGIVLRLPDDGSLDSLPALTEVIAVDPDEVTSRLTSLIGGSALFASRFRECAARALLFPRRDPRRRSPLWQQRQRSAQLLSVAAGYPDFPIVLETVRECLQDVYDLEGLTDLLRALDSGAVRVTEVVTPTPSPFARSLLFGYVAAFLYEGDSPLAERKSAALALDDALLTELLGTADLRELLHPDALPDVEGRLQRLADRAATTTEAAWDMVRRIGPLRIDECGDRGLTVDRLSELGASRRVIRFHHAGGEWVAVSEDAGMLRDALGVALPTGLPEAFLEMRPDAARDLLLRFAGCHGPFTADDVAARFGLGVAVARDQLDSLTRSGVLLSGAFRPGGSGTEYVHPDVLRAVRRASAARYADEIEPVDQAAFAGFPARWQGVGVGRPARGRDGLLDVIDQLAGAPLPASQLESLILPSRVVDYDPALLDDLTTSGEVVWWALDPLPGDAWICLAPRDLAPPLLPTAGAPDADADADGAILGSLGRGGWFADQLAAQVSTEGPGMSTDEVDDLLQRLLWAGLVTNDTIAPVRHRTGAKARPRRTMGRRRVRLATRAGRTVTGRWSALPQASADDPAASLTVAEVLLNRHGLVTRGIVESERRTFAAHYRSLAALEDKGLCRRGYFVDGLGGAQFALSAAADEVRATPGESAAQVLAAADPAQPYGAALPWPDPPGGAGRPGRKAGAVVVLAGGRPCVYVERGGGSALLWPGDNSEAVAALAEAVRSGSVPPLALKRINGVVPDTRHIEVFEAAGAVLSPGGLRLRA